jgi:sulfur-carrier protein
MAAPNMAAPNMAEPTMENPTKTNVKIVYFAWLRETIGVSTEVVEIPDSTATIADLIVVLAARSPAYASAFAKPQLVRAAINHAHVKHDSGLAGAREIAFFPPVTGG